MITDMLRPLSDLPMMPTRGENGEDIYQLFRRMADQSPLVMSNVGVTVALRNRHVELITGSSTRQIELETVLMQGITDGPIFDLTRDALLFANGNVHKHRRTPIARSFAFKLMDAMRPRISALATELVDERLDAGPIDFVGEIAGQLPARIIAEILGIPDSDVPVFLKWIQLTSAAIGFIDPKDRPEIESNLAEFRIYVADLLDERRKHPRDDFLTDYCRETAAAAKLTEAEIRTQILGLILAGSDTTRGSMCMTLKEMLVHPDQWADFVADPDGLKRAVVEEGLRYHPVVAAIPRVALEDIEIDGYHVPTGAVIAVSLIGALRDKSVFRDPDTFNIHREDQQRWHAVFGAGAHRCVGEALARAEMEETLAAIAKRAPKTKLVGPLPVLRFGAIRQVTPMQVAFA